MDKRRELWGPLAERYFTERPRKILALDGGGIRGVLTLEVLHSLERRLADVTGLGQQFRLCDWFDYIGGTSTGAIIATGLARGMSVGELLAFYKQTGPAMFDKRSLWQRWKSLYESQPLAKQLQATFGATTDLSPTHLRCLLLVVTRNVTTDSPWPISSNPEARYNDPARDNCNLRIPLWRLVRASTAAPVFFPPEVIECKPDDPSQSFVFVDGGITPYNNPSFLLYRMATQAAYRLSWKTGERNLLLVSVGTGAAPTLDGDILSPEKNLASNLAGLPGALMYGASVDQDINCRVVGRCVHGAAIDRELGDLIPRGDDGTPLPLSTDLGRAFLYARYNADLSKDGLRALGLGHLQPEEVQKLDSVDHLEELCEVGRRVGEQVDVTPFKAFLG